MQDREVLDWSPASLIAGEKHTLKSTDGRTIEAEITGVTETHAQIVVGRKSMKVDLKKFSKVRKPVWKHGE